VMISGSGRANYNLSMQLAAFSTLKIFSTGFSDASDEIPSAYCCVYTRFCVCEAVCACVCVGYFIYFVLRVSCLVLALVLAVACAPESWM